LTAGAASIVAPAAWQRLAFISDLHLSPATPSTTEAFERLLHDLQADALFILGDLFEAWIGDDIEGDSWSQRVMTSLHAASRRLALHFMAGNRDFLLGSTFLKQHGVLLLQDPCVLEAFGQGVLLCHGDALCLDDLPYQHFRQQVRNPAWQSAFLAHPRAEREAQARKMRDASQAHQANMNDSAGGVTWADAHAEHTTALLNQHQTLVLIHGHTHRPATHQPAVEGAPALSIRHVLSDWHVERHPRRGDVMHWTAAGFERRAIHT
jgi:UDP-2,3-diacylglucosamine hydrolase